MRERLQKIISAAGICSRRAAEGLIAGGRVTVNGETAELGGKADTDSDDIRVDGKPIESNGRLVYIMLNKPRGYVTTLNDERGRKTVAELVKDCGTRVYPCGRLDVDTEGLLLMTNDGAFANRATHPSGEIEKVYRVSAKGVDIAVSLERLRGEFTLDGKKLSPARAELLNETDGGAVLIITVREGRNRQIRRMCESSGLNVTRLIRVREGGLKLDGLKSGQWRYLTKEELNSFFK
jgi:23S rRNA pseudouridine2605 synthase